MAANFKFVKNHQALYFNYVFIRLFFRNLHKTYEDRFGFYPAEIVLKHQSYSCNYFEPKLKNPIYILTSEVYCLNNYYRCVHIIM